MMLNLIALSAIFAFLALGVHISYRRLDFPDLTVDGSFPLGAALCATALHAGLPLPLCLMLSVFGGLAAGALTAALHCKLKLSDLLAGILTMIALYSLNLRIMGRPNMPLMGLTHMFQGPHSWLPLSVLLAATALALKLFFMTRTGLLIQAVGENPNFISSLGKNPDRYKTLGLMLANSLVSLSGALLCLYQGFADIGMGLGMMVAGLASVIIGEKLLHSVIAGAFIYRGLIALAFAAGLAPGDMKLLTAVLILLIVSPKCRLNLFRNPRRSVHANLSQSVQALYHRS